MSDSIYPYVFRPIFHTKIWGGDLLKTALGKTAAPPQAGESWEISAVKGNVSQIANGPLEGMFLDELICKYPPQILGKKTAQKHRAFPLLIKFIDAQDDLSVQVHPDDELAKAHNSFGKTEMWYILQARRGAQIISGFKQKTSPETYAKQEKQSNVLSLLAAYTAKAGQVYFLPAGRVHAIGKGVLLAEVQQTSDITYRIYDYNRTDALGNKRALHTQEAIQALNFEDDGGAPKEPQTPQNGGQNLCACPYFTVNKLSVGSSYKPSYNFDGFVIYLTLAPLKINCAGKTYDFGAWQNILIPAAVKNDLEFCSPADLLEIYLPDQD